MGRMENHRSTQPTTSASQATGAASRHSIYLCGRGPLVLVPHTIMCMRVESFTEENRGSATCGLNISL